MELCTARAFSNLHHRTLFNPSSNPLRWETTYAPFKPSRIIRTGPGSLFFTNSSPRASISDGTPTGEYTREERDGVLVKEAITATEEKSDNEIIATEAPISDSHLDVQAQYFELLENFNIKELLESVSMLDEIVDTLSTLSGYLSNIFVHCSKTIDGEDSYSILLFGTAVLTAVWLGSALVRAVDSIPIFPKLMELVGLGYTVWFSTRYLIFKDNRDELAAKIEDLKQQVLGSNDD